MRHEQTDPPLVGNQVLFLVVFTVLSIVFVCQLGLRVGRWQLSTEASDEDIAQPEPTVSQVDSMLDSSLESVTPENVSKPVQEDTSIGSSGLSAHTLLSDKVSSTTSGLDIQYTVQIGAFRSSARASQLASSFGMDGYSVQVMPPPPGDLHLVWVGLFSTKAEASSFAHRMVGRLESLGLGGYRVRSTRR